MANEFKHKDPCTIITQVEYIGASGDGHIFACQAIGDIVFADSTTVLKRLARGSANEILQIASCKPDWTDSPTLASVAVDNLTINACAITSTAAFTVDATTDIVLDADGDNITFKAGSGDSTGLDFSNSSGTWTVKAGTSDSDLIFQVNDGGTSNTVLTLDGGDSVVYLGGNATKAGELRILEDTDDGANYVAIKAPAIGTSFTLTLPADDGCCGEFLKTNGSGVLDWAAVDSGACAASLVQVEAASATNVYISPGRLRRAPSVAQGWGKIDNSCASSPTVTVSYNVSGVANGSVGNVTVSWCRDFSTANYATLTTAGDQAITNAACPAAGTFIHSTRNGTGHCLTDSANAMFAAFGDQDV